MWMRGCTGCRERPGGGGNNDEETKRIWIRIVGRGVWLSEVKKNRWRDLRLEGGSLHIGCGHMGADVGLDWPRYGPCVRCVR